MKKNLSDKEFFELYCASADIVFNNGDSEIAFIKDKDLNYYYASPAYLNGIRPNGSITLDYVSGKNIPLNDDSVAHKILQEFAEQDLLVQSTLKVHDFLFVSIHDQITLIRKRPIINPATSNFVGIVGNARPFMIPNLLDLIYKINGITFGLANVEQEEPLVYTLTQRQHVVLFLYLNKYSYTEIASIMVTLGQKISAGRVNDHLENLKYIFSVRSKEQLIEKAISLKYHLYIPRQLLKPGSIIMQDQIIVSDV